MRPTRKSFGSRVHARGMVAEWNSNPEVLAHLSLFPFWLDEVAIFPSPQHPKPPVQLQLGLSVTIQSYDSYDLMIA